MFSSFLGEKFSSKCKHAVKCIKMRIQPIRKKKQAVVRFLKKDVADLIAAGYEANAFGRIDALLVETNHVFCYDLIQKFSEHVLDQLPALQKQRECPEEVTEEISTLIYAAARFPDLPDLRVLRHLFVEKYGSSMESSVCSEFAEKLKNKTFSKEKKLQLMESIAQEYCISWDAKKIDEEARNAPTPKSVLLQAQHKEVTPPYAGNNDASLLEDGIDKEIHSSNLPSVVRRHQVEMELTDIPVISAANTGHPLEPQYEINSAVPSYDKHYGSPRGALKHDQRAQNRREHVLNSSIEEKGVVSLKPLNPRPVNATPPYTKSNATGYHVEETRAEIRYDCRVEEHEEELDSGELRKQSTRPLNKNGRAANLIPPDCTPKFKDTPTKCDKTIQNTTIEETSHQSNRVSRHEKSPLSVRKELQTPMVAETDGCTAINNERPRSHIAGGRDDEEKATTRDSTEDDEIDDNAIYYEELSPPTSGGKKRHGGRRNEEEEKVVDTLLKHYARKGTSAKEPGKERPRQEAVSPLEKVVSLPSAPVSQAEAKMLARTTLVQTDTSGGRRHPRLPDYDQFVASLAALK